MNTSARDAATSGTSAATSSRRRHTGKAVLAGAVALGLLAAGGGTFSRWSEERQITDDSISSGEMSLATVNAPVWTDQHGTIDPSVFKMVPGDTVTFSSTTRITAVGDNLTASLALDAAGMVIDDPALVRELNVDTTITGLADTDGADGYTVVGQEGSTAHDNGATANVTITIAWPATRADGSNWGTDTPDAATGSGAGEASTVNLDALKLRLTQNA